MTSHRKALVRAGWSGIVDQGDAESRVSLQARDFGVVADGSTDDTAAIQKAIDLVERLGGGIVELGSGTHLHTGLTVTGDKSVWLRGLGWSTVLKNTEANSVGITIGDAAAIQTADCRVTDMQVTGAAGTGVGIKLLRMQSSRLENVRVDNHGGNGVDMQGCYASWFEKVYSNNNGGDGFHAHPKADGAGNDHLMFLECRALGNTGDGFHIEGDFPGLVMSGCDAEGNAVGVKLDTGTQGQSEGVTLLGCYFENNTGKNISIGEDAGATRNVRGLSILGCVFNPGTVDAATNAVSLANVSSALIANSHFSTCDLVLASTAKAILQGNFYSSASGPFGTSEPPLGAVNAASATGSFAIKPAGWDTFQRWGPQYAGNKLVLSHNLDMSADGAGTQDDTGEGSSALVLSSNLGRLVRCAAGGGAALSNVFTFDDIEFLFHQPTGLPVYTDATRPAANTLSAGVGIWNSDDNAPNYSDGAAWRDAAGAAT